ncbi:MAG: Holliday junction ATP-dependent DNA helicase RuvA [Parcubacteria bacterium 32_520]|nr:MAG: Holliday junction ATP-dependent DNA helicase RuvA [Parcubacteria bacterium 32_520]
MISYIKGTIRHIDNKLITIEKSGIGFDVKLKLFKTLKSISGVGPKSALDLSFVDSLEELKSLIEKGEIKGIGDKKLQKILLEITGKVKSINNKIDNDALSGLISLGFKKSQAQEALKKVSNEIKDTEQRIKEALKLL